ncbi:hypothetical protein [Herbaspirillum sp. SJZ107]|uniref:hypothetical protein n=1 Tax=Herbaspirillum sp. SJZ107 TaxID=2572881 RepID=UPI00116FA913|nr:hypothetical protein [Herbaspirillum sp. SJZ107]TQK11165.1 hypothetical protein FBX97_1103 [Herbaspirillum sp. SJZ107]
MSVLHACTSVLPPMLSPVLPGWGCDLAAMGLYLVPSLALAFLIWIVTAAHPLFFIFSAAGTLCHELAHFSVGLLLGAEPVGFSIIPRRSGRTWELGSVTFANLRWYNAAPAALAPFLVLLLPLAAAWWRTRGDWRFGPADLALTLLLAPQFLSFWPSPVDWKLARRSWPWLLIVLTTAALLYWFQPSLFRFVKF